jgi:hypothetical protein
MQPSAGFLEMHLKTRKLCRLQILTVAHSIGWGSLLSPLLASALNYKGLVFTYSSRYCSENYSRDDFYLLSRVAGASKGSRESIGLGKCLTQPSADHSEGREDTHEYKVVSCSL